MNIINFTTEDDQTGDVENPYQNGDPTATSTPQLQSFENPFTTTQTFTPQISTSQMSTPQTVNSNWLSDSEANIINNAVTNGTYEADIPPPFPPSYTMTDEERERMRNARLSRLEMANYPPPPKITAQQKLKAKKSKAPKGSPKPQPTILTLPQTPSEKKQSPSSTITTTHKKNLPRLQGLENPQERASLPNSIVLSNKVFYKVLFSMVFK